MSKDAAETVADQSTQDSDSASKPVPSPADLAPNSSATEQSETLPDDHPLVKTLAAQKDQIRALKAANQETSEKAKQFDELQEANKSEMQKLIDRAESAEKDAETLRSEKTHRDMAAKVSGETGVPVDLLVGDTEDDMREYAGKLRAYRGPETSAPPASIVGNADDTPANQTKQLTQADLQSMTSAQIVAADRAGQLDQLKGVSK
jgi:hypothetical protein